MMKLLTITGLSKEWLEGNHGALDIKVRRGCSVFLNLAGKKEQILSALTDKDTWCRAEFVFSRPRVVAPYQIELYGESAYAILEMVDALWDTEVDSVAFHDCPGMEQLRFHNVGDFDFSGCANLEYLDCDGFRGNQLNLTNLSRLKSLRCHNGQSNTIELSKSPDLIALDLLGCKMKQLKVGNRVTLQELNIDCCEHLNTRTQEWLEAKVKNGVDLNPTEDTKH